MLIVIVPANPKPRDRITLKNADGTIPARYSHRPDVFFSVDTFEVQGWVKGILCPQAVGFSGLTFNIFVKRPVGSPKRW
jgi:hypothetical protein